MPWKLVADPTGYIFTWLVGYSALLGSIGGVLIADYFVLRRAVLDLPGLYGKAAPHPNDDLPYRSPTLHAPKGPYWYRSGWNPAAFLALVAGIAPNLPGFLGTVRWATVSPFWISLYHYAWFVGFAISFGVYLAAMRAFGTLPSRTATVSA